MALVVEPVETMARLLPVVLLHSLLGLVTMVAKVIPLTETGTAVVEVEPVQSVTPINPAVPVVATVGTVCHIRSGLPQPLQVTLTIMLAVVAVVTATQKERVQALAVPVVGETDTVIMLPETLELTAPVVVAAVEALKPLVETVETVS